MFVLLLTVQSRATGTTVSSGSPDDFQAALSSTVSSGGGTILVTTPILIGGTNGSATYGFDGASEVSVSGGSTNSIFIVGEGGDLIVSNMALEDGLSTNAGGAVYVYDGGSALFTNCVFSNNIALGAAGFSSYATTNGSNVVIYTGRAGAGQPAFGGAIFNLGSVTVLNCQFVTNSAIGGSGGNGSNGGSGITRGGNGGKGAAGGIALGGGICTAGPLLIVNSTFANNAAEGGAGGTGGAGGSGLIAGLTGGGGAGGAAAGAGLYSVNPALVTISSSTFSGNIAQGGASQTGGTSSAGIGQSGPHGGFAYGGGVVNDLGSVMTFTNCTFFQNTASGGAGGNGGVGGGRGGAGGNGGNATGGGIYNVGTVTVVNCTFFQDAAIGGTNGAVGSGVSSPKNGSRGGSHGGNIANVANKKKGSFTLANSIIGANLSGGGGFGPFIDDGYNISADRTINFKSAKKGGASLSNTNPLLGDLAQNGGPTETIAIISTNSPAVNFIRTNDYPPVDQRGVSRPQLTYADAGAFELIPNELTIISQPQSTNVPVGSNAIFSVTISGPQADYQWYSSSSNVVADATDLLAGQTNSTLELTNVQLTNSGQQFEAVITNATYAITSSVAILTVYPITNTPAGITAISPVSQTVLAYTNITISVTVTGTPPINFQWYFQNFANGSITNLSNSGNISGATSNILSIVNVQTTNSGNYFVVVSNAYGVDQSSDSVLEVQSNDGGGILPPFPTETADPANVSPPLVLTPPNEAAPPTSAEYIRLRGTAFVPLVRGMAERFGRVQDVLSGENRSDLKVAPLLRARHLMPLDGESPSWPPDRIYLSSSPAAHKSYIPIHLASTRNHWCRSSSGMFANRCTS